ncbi:flagellar basal-body rod protein FlgG [Novipirellula artificiosorum]|uniref:Flagellar basal-body rod protein FlgG n=1 Tax=Novipirellula artificiosorum TaxID=2528016 RepID=A0A5C6DHE5_9BACT|nr:flagellar basal-body rod protein FlgG [Novipirellula artificiosorum]TWU34466.1 Flagellar basal-body rod protein FlgG [Novipirellula artificiosorum]
MSVQSLYTAATGMGAMETKLDVIANNLANINTTGFKKDRANFEDLLYRTEVYPGVKDASQNPTAVGTQVGLGVRVTSTQTDQRQGTLQQTGRELDVAIRGSGYLKTIDPSTQDTMYTRAGNLDINANGQLVIGSAQTGRLLEPPITIPQDASAITINGSGEIMVRQPGNAELSTVGQIELAQFINPDGLLKMGENMYLQTDASGQEISGNPGEQGLGTLVQGNLEASNVEPVQELIDLITTQRAFELNSQAIQAGDQVMQNISNLRRF